MALETNNEQVKSKRDLLVDRLKKRNPDKDYSNDDVFYAQINDDYDGYDDRLNKYRDREKGLTDAFTRDPRNAQFVIDMAEGKNPLKSFIGLIGIDGIREMLDDPDKVEEYAADNKEYVDRIAKQRDLEQQWQKNIQATLQMFEQKQKELNLSDEQIDKIADWIKDVMNDGVVGIVKPETFDMAYKAINHDSDVAQADQEGEVRGRNAKVEATLRKPKRGDGTPTLAGANNAPEQRLGKRSLFDLAEEAR